MLEAYSVFFLGTAMLGIPALLLCAWVAYRKPVPRPSVALP